jgi:hypothetical protein
MTRTQTGRRITNPPLETMAQSSSTPRPVEVACFLPALDDGEHPVQDGAMAVDCTEATSASLNTRNTLAIN